MGKRCLLVLGFSFIIAFLCCLLFGQRLSQRARAEGKNQAEDVSQEKQDDLDVEALDPFKDLQKIKDIAQRKFYHRRLILREACKKVKQSMSSWDAFIHLYFLFSSFSVKSSSERKEEALRLLLGTWE